MKKNLFILSFFLFGFSACSLYDPVEFVAVDSVVMDEIKGGKAGLNIGIKLHNPNKAKFKVQDYDIDIFLNGKPFGIVKMADNMIISGKSDNIYYIQTETDINQVISNLPLIISLVGKGEAELSLKGHIRVKTSIFSKSIPLDIKEIVTAEHLSLLK
jgi:LEA14-like dessication related protein